MRALLLALGIAGVAPLASGQSVSLAGLLGSRALLVIEGQAPRAVAVGETVSGVTVRSITAEAAVIEVGGRQQTLRLGETPTQIGGGLSADAGRRIVLTGDSRGHFITPGTLNGQAVTFMVDTGASAIGLGQSDADRIGLAYRSGRPVRLGTANGVVTGWLLKARSIRIGDVEIFDVDTVVTPQAMPYVLLGNSYLGRFQMRRENDQLTLDRRD